MKVVNQRHDELVTAAEPEKQAAVQKLDDSLEEVWEKQRDFAASLVKQYREKGCLSPTQWYWVAKLTQRAEQGGAKTIQLGDMSGLIKLFDHAKKHLKYPKIRLTTPPFAVRFVCPTPGCRFVITRKADDGADLQEIAKKKITCPDRSVPHAANTLLRSKLAGHPVLLSVAGGKSKYTGQIMVSDGGPYGDNVWYGRIDRDGKWTLPFNVPEHIDAIRTLLQEMAERPEETAAQYGKLHGSCCFCSNPLSDERSTEVGYGPTCAKNFGLKWGQTKKAHHAAVQEEKVSGPFAADEPPDEGFSTSPRENFTTVFADMDMQITGQKAHYIIVDEAFSAGMGDAIYELWKKTT